MRVFVTGASGFLGTHVCAALRAENVEVAGLTRSAESAQRLRDAGVVAIEGDVTDGAAIRRALAVPTDAIFHCAADTSTWRGGNVEQTRTNVEGTRTLLDAAIAARVRRFVHTSSVSAYGQTDETLHEQLPLRGAESWINYARSKARGEALVHEVGGSGVIETVVLNPAHMLGPGDTRNWGRLFLLVDRGELPGAPPGSGAFADVREIAIAHVRAWRDAPSGENYLLGGEHISFLDLIRLIAATLGRSAPRRATPAPLLKTYARLSALAARLAGRVPSITPESASFTCHHLRVDSSKAERALGYRATPLATLVADTAASLRELGMLRPA